MSRYFCCFFLLIVACSAEQGSKKPDADSIENTKSLVAIGVQPGPCIGVNTGEKLVSLNNDSLLTGIVEKLTPAYIDGLFAGNTLRSILRPNLYVKDQHDTVRTYVAGCDSAVYIASKANTFPLYVTIQTATSAWRAGLLKMGMPREAFLKLIKAGDIKEDVIKITETEAGNELLFVFRQGVLVRFDYRNLYVE